MSSVSSIRIVRTTTTILMHVCHPNGVRHDLVCTGDVIAVAGKKRVDPKAPGSMSAAFGVDSDSLGVGARIPVCLNRTTPAPAQRRRCGTCGVEQRRGLREST